MSDTGQSYNEQILQSIIDGEPYVNENPYPSKIEVLLMELKDLIETSSGGATITPLWSDSSGAQVNVVNTLAQSIDDFDVIYLKCGNPTDISVNNNYSNISFMPSMIASGEKISGEFYKERYFQASFAGNTFTLTARGSVGESGNYDPTIYSVVGIKY